MGQMCRCSSGLVNFHLKVETTASKMIKELRLKVRVRCDDEMLPRL